MFVLDDNAKKFEEGAKELLKFYKLPDSKEVTVSFEETSNGEVALSYDGKSAKIKGIIPANFYRMLCTLAAHISKEDKPFEVKEHFSFSLFGNMIDCSRNSVLTVDAVKKYVRFLASCGMNMMMLYTEDTYEIKEYPYFGAYRGRYTAEELKEIDDYAFKFGIEVIPCIQTLAHLKTALRWPVFDEISDTDDILLVGDEKTYKFIEAEIKAVSSCFRSRRVHVGMDEALRLGLGDYLKKNGYRSKQELMIEHLTKVQKICEDMGLETIIWSDMFFRVLSPTGSYYEIPEGVDTFPFDFSKKCHLTYWDYYHTDYEHYKRFLALHLDADKECYFAGGGWTWNGLCPNFDKAFWTSKPGVKAAKDVGMKNVFCTMWQDNGAETSQSAGLPSVLYFAELGYCDGDVDLDDFSQKLLFLTGLPFESYKLMSDMDKVPNRTDDNPEVTVTKYALYQDPMIGMFDLHIKGTGLKEHYEKLYEKFKALKYKNKLTEYYEELAGTLAIKAELGIELTQAYKAGDKERLEVLAGEKIPECIEHLEKARELREEIWLSESKPFGFEIIDIRFNGVIGRLCYANRRINDYLEGKTDSLPELEEERIYANPYVTDSPLYVNQWDKIASACSFVGV